jgi:RNase P subunit RPR2
MLPVDIQITYQVVNCAHCKKMLAGGRRIVVNDQGEFFCDMICEESWRHRYSYIMTSWDGWRDVDRGHPH